MLQCFARDQEEDSEDERLPGQTVGNSWRCTGGTLPSPSERDCRQQEEEGTSAVLRLECLFQTVYVTCFYQIRSCTTDDWQDKV